MEMRGPPNIVQECQVVTAVPRYLVYKGERYSLAASDPQNEFIYPERDDS